MHEYIRVHIECEFDFFFSYSYGCNQVFVSLSGLFFGGGRISRERA